MPHPRQCLERVRTMPNALTAARLVLTVLAAVLFANSDRAGAGVVLCGIGALLDGVDGWWARRFGQRTRFGALMDPIADKVLMIVVYGTLAVLARSIVVWLLLGAVTTRDVVVTVQRIRRYRDGDTPSADGFGKIKMIVQSIGGIGLLAYVLLWPGTGQIPYLSLVMMLAVVALLSCLSARPLISEWSGVVPRGLRRSKTA